MSHSEAVSVISIRKSTDELDRVDNLRLAIADCYTVAIQSSSEYAVEVDPAQASKFRDRLSAVDKQWQAAADPTELRAVGQAFRGELRDYQRVAGESLDVLRRDMQAAADAIAAFAGGIAAQGTDHEVQLKQELDRLRGAAQSDDLEQIRAAIQTAISGIHAALKQMKLSNSLAIAQLQDEIRLLHREVDGDRQHPVKPVPSLRTRPQMEQKIDEALATGKPFCLLLIAIREWKPVTRAHPCAAVGAAVQEMIGRLHSAVDPDLILGQWSEEELVAILMVDPATAIAISREASFVLSGSYEIEENGQLRTVELKVKAGVIDRATSSESFDFRAKLSALAAALSRG